jgi:hypothetical protein
MKRIAGLLAFVIGFAACQKEDTNSEILRASSTGELYGRYNGTFSRTGRGSSEVKFFFKDNNTYEGSSDSPRFPAICGGRFSQEGSRLIVDDTCSWTADFDWTLIFDGTFNIEYLDDNSVRLWRSSETVTDEYLLHRMDR